MCEDKVHVNSIILKINEYTHMKFVDRGYNAKKIYIIDLENFGNAISQDLTPQQPSNKKPFNTPLVAINFKWLQSVTT